MIPETNQGEEVEALEGDEGEPEVGRRRDVGRQILLTRLSEIKASSAPVTIGAQVTVARAVELMKKKRVSAVMVVEGKKPKKLVGLFTERDFLNRALGSKGLGRLPVKKLMTRDPEALSPGDSVAYALNKMHVGRYRHVPLVDGEGAPVGMISARDLIDFLVELCPEEIMNLPPAPRYAVPRTREGE